MIFIIFGSQNGHFGTKKGVFRVILLNVALKVYLNRFKVDGCGFLIQFFIAIKMNIFSKWFLIFLGPKMPILGPKRRFRVIWLNAALMVYLNRFTMDGCKFLIQFFAAIEIKIFLTWFLTFSGPKIPILGPKRRF